MTRSRRGPSVAALNRRFHAAYSRHLELLTASGWPDRDDVEAVNAWHGERAEVCEELSAIYGDLRDTVTDIANVVWHSHQAAHQMWHADAERHRSYIKEKEIGGNCE